MFRVLAVLMAAAACAAGADSSAIAPVLLRSNWMIQASADAREAGSVISSSQFSTRGWYRATLPSTVFRALVRDQVYPDPYTGMNLRAVAGVSYPISSNFSNTPMPPESPFRNSWWYRTEFKLDASFKGKTVWLGFDGINYRANVWLNGKEVAESRKVAGAWRVYEFDVTAIARPGEANQLAVEVFPPQPDDLAITFVDWNPQPPDKNMGLWRDVWVSATGPVAIRYPTVATKLNAGAAHLSVRAELKNASNRAIDGTFKGKIEAQEFSESVRLNPGETRMVHASVTVANPRLWWPSNTGAPNLYPLDVQFESGGSVSDSRHIDFGIREITSEVDAKNHRLFRVNGRNILIRGAGYTFDMLLASSPDRQEAELKYVKDMNLNAIRLEGKMEDDHFLELCDRYGIMVLAGWCCCDIWERWQEWDDEDHVVAGESLRDQLRRLERHPSVIDFMYGSDNPPPVKVEQMYLGILKEVEWPNPYHSSATAKPTPAGPTGVKMTGPYEYVAPAYWLLDQTRGGAHGFNTETSPGPAPPPVESLRRMLPEDKLWPINSAWDYHAGGGAFKDIHVFTEALNARYGPSRSVEEYARKAQMMAYEGHRAMFEAFGRNKYTATGVIQWMLNNAWPGLIWHLYDWYLRPGGSYFGAKIANEPLHVQYSYDDRSIVVVNSRYQPFAGMKVATRVIGADMAEKFSREVKADIAEDSSTRVLTLPEISGLSSTYFVSLQLLSAEGAIVSRNFYWLSSKPETLDWDKSNWYMTPTKTFADFTALNSLPPAALKVASENKQDGASRTTVVTVTNTGKSLAFGVRLKLCKNPGGDEVLPVLWEDNYISLLPGETRVVAATYSARDLGRATPTVEFEAWNRNR
jgi:exo-1,4-beta-D-glucosaminidase